ETMDPIFEGIMRDIPATKDNSDEPLQMQMTLLDYNDYVGRIGIGRVSRGKIHVGQQVVLLKKDGTEKKFRVTKLFGVIGLKRTEIKEEQAGDIIAVSGMDDINSGDTVCTAEHPDALPLLHIDKPTLQIAFVVNNSPIAGKEGKYITSAKIEERLKTLLETDVSLRVDPTDSPDAWVVSG